MIFFKGIRGRIIKNNLILLLISLVFLGATLVAVLEDFYLSSLEHAIISQAKMYSQVILEDIVAQNYDRLNEKVNLIGLNNDYRLTVVLPDGKVVADTKVDPILMGNHGARPEIRKALQGKVASELRFSENLQMNMIYLAYPIVQEEQLLAITRMSLPLEEVKEVYFQLRLILLLAVIFSLVFSMPFMMRLSKSFLVPIKNIIKDSKKITDGDLDVKIYSNTNDEIGRLGENINLMANSLKQNIADLTENRNRLSVIINNISSGIIFIDDKGQLRELNQAAEKVLGLKRERVLNRNYQEAFLVPSLQESITESLAKAEVLRKNIVIYQPEDRILECYFEPLLQKEKIIGEIIVVRDITQSYTLEKMRRDFVANASHELKTPLTVIQGYSETLLAGALNDRENAEKFIRIINDESNRLREMVNDLLVLSKTEAGQQKKRQEIIDLEELIREVSRDLAAKVEAKQLEYKITEAKGICRVRADLKEIKQVIINLLDNAIKYSNTKGKVEIKLFQNGKGYVKVEIKDEGVGISQEELGRIFERFYRVDKARIREKGGFGLGLAIVKNIVEANKGEIGVESEEGKGSVFWFILPCAQ